MGYDNRRSNNYRNNNRNDDRRPAWKQQEHGGSQVCPLEVVVFNNDIDGALKVLKNKISKDGILTQLKTKKYAMSTGQKKRNKHREALKKLRKSRGKKVRARIENKDRDK